MEGLVDMPKCLECGREFDTLGALQIHRWCHVRKRPIKCPKCPFRADSDYRLELHLHKHNEDRFECNICKKNFKWKANLTSHMKLHIGEGLHICKICDHKCLTKSILERHLDTHAKILQYRCKTCGKEFKHKQNLNQHIKIHTGKGLHKCKICKKSFTSSSLLKNHMDTHSSQPNYSCDICKKRFRTKLVLRHHRRMHTQDRVKVCPHCGMMFPILSKLKAHMETHSSEPQHECDVCNKKYKHKRALLRHKQMEHGQGDCVVYNCEKCGKKFPSPSMLHYHMDSHSTVDQYRCATCGDSFRRVRQLRYHLKIHTGIGLLKCQVCSKTFFNPSSLAAHMESHATSLDYKCDVCGNKYKNKRALQTHKENTHEHSGMTYTCDQCDKVYKHLPQLNQHKRIHTGRGLLECQTCGRQFVKLSEYRRHMDSHSTEPKYECDICHKKYKHYNDVKIHRRIHTAEAIKCDICGKLFATKQQLMFHIVVHSDDLPFKCKRCSAGFKYESSLMKHWKMHLYSKPVKSNGRRNTIPIKNRGWKKYADMREQASSEKENLPDPNSRMAQNRRTYSKKKPIQDPEKQTQKRGKFTHIRQNIKVERVAGAGCVACAKMYPIKVKGEVCKLLHGRLGNPWVQLVNVEDFLRSSDATMKEILGDPGVQWVPEKWVMLEKPNKSPLGKGVKSLAAKKLAVSQGKMPVGIMQKAVEKSGRASAKTTKGKGSKMIEGKDIAFEEVLANDQAGVEMPNNGTQGVPDNITVPSMSENFAVTVLPPVGENLAITVLEPGQRIVAIKSVAKQGQQAVQVKMPIIQRWRAVTNKKMPVSVGSLTHSQIAKSRPASQRIASRKTKQLAMNIKKEKSDTPKKGKAQLKKMVSESDASQFKRPIDMTDSPIKRFYRKAKEKLKPRRISAGQEIDSAVVMEVMSDVLFSAKDRQEYEEDMSDQASDVIIVNDIHYVDFNDFEGHDISFENDGIGESQVIVISDGTTVQQDGQIEKEVEDVMNDLVMNVNGPVTRSRASVKGITFKGSEDICRSSTPNGALDNESCTTSTMMQPLDLSLPKSVSVSTKKHVCNVEQAQDLRVTRRAAQKIFIPQPQGQGQPSTSQGQGQFEGGPVPCELSCDSIAGGQTLAFNSDAQSLGGSNVYPSEENAIIIKTERGWQLQQRVVTRSLSNPASPCPHIGTIIIPNHDQLDGQGRFGYDDQCHSQDQCLCNVQAQTSPCGHLPVIELPTNQGTDYNQYCEIESQAEIGVMSMCQSHNQPISAQITTSTER